MAFDAVQFIQAFIKADTNQQNALYEDFYYRLVLKDQQIIFFNTITELLKTTPETAKEYPAIVFLAGCSHYFDHHKESSEETALKLFSQASQSTHPLSVCMHGNVLWEKDELEHYPTAILLLERAISLNCPFAMVIKGEYDLLGEGQQVAQAPAIDLYEKAIRLNSPQAMINRGLLYKAEGATNAYLALVEKARDLGSPAALTELGFIQSEAGHLEEAEKFYDLAIEKDYPEAMGLKAKLLMKRGDSAGAIILLDKLYQNSEDPGSAYLRGQLYEQAKDYLTALALYKTCIEDHEHPQSMIASGLLYWEGTGIKVDRVRALSHFKNALNLKVREGIPPLALGMIAEEKKNYATACNHYDKAIACNNSEAMVRRATLSKKGQGGSPCKEREIELLERAIKLNNAEAMYLRAQYITEDKQSTFKQKQYAKELYDKAIALGDVKSLRERGKMYAATRIPRQMEKARVLFVLANYNCHRMIGIEDEGFNTVMVKGKQNKITEKSLYSLAQALNFLNSLPDSYARYTSTKNKILNAVEHSIIKKYPLDTHFYSQLAKLDTKTIDGIFYLIHEYALAKYNKQGLIDVEKKLSFETMAKSKDPAALKILEKLAVPYPHKLDYWVGMGHLTQNQSAGFFGKSGKHLALKWFQKAIDNPQTDEVMRGLALEQIAVLTQGKPQLPVNDNNAILLTEYTTTKKPDHSQFVQPPVNEPESTNYQGPQ